MAKRRRHAIRLALLPLLLTFIVGCGDKGAAQAEAKKSAPAVPVLTGQVVEKPMPMRLHAIGTVEPIASVAIKARVDGLIVKVHVRDGQDVVKGDLLFQLDPKPYRVPNGACRKPIWRATRRNSNTRKDRKRRYKELLEQQFRVSGRLCTGGGQFAGAGIHGQGERIGSQSRPDQPWLRDDPLADQRPRRQGAAHRRQPGQGQ